jgi:hypothetical protein
MRISRPVVCNGPFVGIFGSSLDAEPNVVWRIFSGNCYAKSSTSVGLMVRVAAFAPAAITLYLIYIFLNQLYYFNGLVSNKYIAYRNRNAKIAIPIRVEARRKMVTLVFMVFDEVVLDYS